MKNRKVAFCKRPYIFSIPRIGYLSSINGENFSGREQGGCPVSIKKSKTQVMKGRKLLAEDVTPLPANTYNENMIEPKIIRRNSVVLIQGLYGDVIN
ncbi:MAG: hypothetical protein K8S55_06985, partial [Phycisphaerae bacterium]|nr:hypothetical protein [Phycisphaerae bacterium]